jgi:hypothetical protein
VGLLEPFCGLQLACLGSLDIGEYCASSFLAFHVLLYLKLGLLGDYLHTDCLQCSVVVLDVLVGSEGGVNSVLLLHVLLGLVPLSGHLVELVGGLDLENADTGDGDQHGLGILLGLVSLLFLVLLFKPVGKLDLESWITGDVDRHRLSLPLRLGVLLTTVLLVSLLVKLVCGLGCEGDVVGKVGQHVLSVVLRLGVLLNSVPLVNLHFNTVLDKCSFGDDYWRLSKQVGVLVLGTVVGRQLVLGVLPRLVGLLTRVVLDAGACGPLVLGAQLCLSGLLTLVFLGDLLVNLVLTQARFFLLLISLQSA